MPQMNKGGKFVFGKSNIQESGKVQFPIQAMAEYQITAEGKVYLFTGSKVTGGFCVTRKGDVYKRQPKCCPKPWAAAPSSPAR